MWKLLFLFERETVRASDIHPVRVKFIEQQALQGSLVHIGIV